MFQRRRHVSALVLFLFVGAGLRAQFIRPDGATTSSQFLDGSNYLVTNTINGSGLPGGFDASSSHASYAAGNHWTTAGGAIAGVTATYTFTTAQTLDAFYLWNHLSTVGVAASNGYAVANFDLRFYDGSSTLVGSLLGQTAAKNVATAQTYSFSPISNVRSVVFTINSNHGDANYTGLAEVAFQATSAIPEPASIAVWMGVAAASLVVWRQRRPQPS